MNSDNEIARMRIELNKLSSEEGLRSRFEFLEYYLETMVDALEGAVHGLASKDRETTENGVDDACYALGEMKKIIFEEKVATAALHEAELARVARLKSDFAQLAWRKVEAA